MAEIRKENGKWMADGKELDFSGVQKLSDDELENVDGGIRIYTKSHWYGNEYLVCGNCKSKSWTIIGAREPNELQIRCDKCGRISWEKIDT
ncbi:MAG: hypothetical protein KHW46_03315 [Clostridiales bacterium]|nr:hypothetical protein [Clostridiales bacterium]